MPIWARIEDEIVRAHYIQLLARTLAVDESDIRHQMLKTSNVKSSKSGQKPGIEPLTFSTDILEEYLVELAIKGNKLSELPELGNPFWKKVVTYLKSGNISELPAELKARTEELMLHESEYSDREWTKTLTRLEEQNLKRQLKQEVNPANIQKISQKLSNLTKERQ